MSVPAQAAPLAAQALQQVGYFLEEDIPVTTKPPQPLTCQLHSDTATKSVLSTSKTFYHLPLDIDPMVIPLRVTKMIQTGVSIDSGKKKLYAEIKQQLNTHNKNLLLFTGDIELTKDREIISIVHNLGNTELTLTKDDSIATLHFQWQQLEPLPVENKMEDVENEFKRTTRSQTKANNFQAAKLEAYMQVSLDLLYDLHFSSDPYNSHTHRAITSILVVQHLA